MTVNLDHLHLQLTRRHFLRNGTLGLGSMALASLASASPPRIISIRSTSGRGTSPPVPARDLPVHGRRPQPSRTLRSQADAGAARRPDRAGVVHAKHTNN